MANQNIKGYKPDTIQSRVIAVNFFLKWLKKPKKWQLKRPGWKDTTRDTLTLEEINLLRDRSQELSPEHQLIILFITDMDARNNEICNAKFSNIKGNKFFFDDTKTGDNYGYITHDLFKAFEDYKKIRPIPCKGYEDYILLGSRDHYKGKKYSDHGQHIRTVINEICYHAKVGRHITPYDLRASVITEEFNYCINPKTIQRKARHRDWKTTQKYNHVTDKMVEDYANSGLIFNNSDLFKAKRKLLSINNYLFKC